jgi:hypothetical protein
MRTWILLLIAALPSTVAAAEKEHRYQMSLRDEFVVAPDNSWKVEEEKQGYMPLRFANVKITPREGENFSLMLYFKCDTPDLANFDSIEKMERSIRVSSKPYLRHSVEKTIKIKKMKLDGSYGCYVVLTDAETAKKKKLEPGEFKYITRGLVRLSPDSALGFSLMTTSIDSPQYRKVMNYIRGFIKKSKKTPV